MKYLPLLLVLTTTPAIAQQQHSSVFDPIVMENSTDCVSMDKVAALATDGVATLNNDEFQTVRAMFIMIPPISEVLPVGDHAFIAKAGNDYLFGLYGDGLIQGKPAENVTCARFEPVGHLAEMIIQIGLGAKGKIPGEGL